MNPEIAQQIAEILASMSIDEIRALVAEMEARIAPPEARIRYVLAPLADLSVCNRIHFVID